MKFFVVGVDLEATTEQRDAFTNYLQALPGAGTWHDVSHTWLIRDTSGTLTAAMLRDKAREVMPRATNIVVEARPRDYGAFSAISGHAWLENYVLEK